MRFIFTALLLLITFGSGDVASAETPEELTKQCQKGSAKACDNLGNLYNDGTGVMKDYFKAVEFYRKACEGQQAGGCANLGWMYEKGRGVTQDAVKAVALYRKACDAQNARGCNNLGLMYANGAGVTQDAVTAVELYRKACDGQYARACFNLGWVYYSPNEEKTGVPRDGLKAMEFFGKACDGQHAEGCFYLGKVYTDGWNVPKGTVDSVKAMEFYRKGCDGKDEKACWALGLQETLILEAQQCQKGNAEICELLGFRYAYAKGVMPDDAKAAEFYLKACEQEAVRCVILGEQYGPGDEPRMIPHDDAKAAEFYRKACDAQQAAGCSNLGIMYHNGTGVRQDAVKAVELYRKACDGQEARGCFNLGVAYANGTGVRQDAVKAVELYRKTCDGQQAAGCSNLGIMYHNGTGVRQDAVKAVELYRKACDAQEAIGCSNLGMMYELGTGVRRSVDAARKFYDKGCKLGAKEGCTLYTNLLAQGKMPRATPPLPVPSQHAEGALDNDRKKLAEERNALANDRQQLEQERRRQEVAKASSPLSLHATATQPDANGDFVITVQTSVDTASLKIDGEEQGGNRDGTYVIHRVARVGEQNVYTISARDVYGNTDTKTVTIARPAADSSPSIPRLNPANVRVQRSQDDVAIIIGIENYKRVAKADFANADAKDFYTYASRALGIRAENIKLLVDDGADVPEILAAFQNWLPLKVNKGKTNVFVFYSGHGYPSQDGKDQYFLPFNVDKQYLDRTSIKQKELIAALVAAAPKSVTMFIDACYSGQTRSGELLLASARPFVLKMDAIAYPANFTVISASSQDQISSSSPELKHGIFSFYLMKGLEGPADGNQDGTITAGEMQAYLSDTVARQAMGMNRQQQTQLVGDAARVLVGR